MLQNPMGLFHLRDLNMKFVIDSHPVFKIHTDTVSPHMVPPWVGH